MEKRRIKEPELWGMIALMATGYILIHDLLGGTLFAHSHWDSYTLQSLAWLRGELGLGRNYEWLELAIYNGDWYCSFPPVPSVVMLPFAAVFGENTPNNLLIAVYAIITAAIIYNIARQYEASPSISAFTAIFAVCGSNMMWMSTNGGVWFQAQALNMLFIAAAVYCAQKNRRTAAYAFIALAVGCRPFSIMYFMPFIVLFAVHDKKITAKHALSLLPAVIIGICYMAFNYARFENVFEFGHNYLPEFVEAENGQFHWSYILPNLYQIFIRPITINADLSLDYPIFNGFMFYIANPIFILFFVMLAKDVIRRRMSAVKITVCIAMLIQLIVLAAHKTMGGWQFGARYMVDFIPYILIWFSLDKKTEFKKWEKFVGIFAVMFNVYGTFAMNFLYG